jgi:hypothetical protein
MAAMHWLYIKILIVEVEWSGKLSNASVKMGRTVA